MSAGKMTPGPWAFAVYDKGVEIATVAHVGEYVVGIPTPGYPGGNYRDSEFGSDAADARAIAAVPELVAALRDLHDTMSRFPGDLADKAEASVLNARAVLARIDGDAA